MIDHAHRKEADRLLGFNLGHAGDGGDESLVGMSPCWTRDGEDACSLPSSR